MRGSKMQKSVEKYKVQYANTSLEAKWALAHCPLCGTACRVQNGRQVAQNGRRGLERGFPPRFLDAPINFS